MLKYFVSLLLIFLFVLESNFFAYAYWNPTVGGQLRHLILLFLTFVIIIYHKKIHRWSSGLGHVIKLLCIISIFNIIPGFIYWGIPLKEGLNIYVPLIFLIFYIYKIFNFSEKDVFRLFLTLTIVVATIQIVQQIFPSKALFGIFSDQNLDWGKGNIVEVRNGLNRYRIGTTSVTLLCMYYFWAKLMIKRSKGTLFMFMLMLVSLYLYLTRQLLVFSALTLILSFFMIDNTRKRVLYICLISIMCIIIYNFSTLLFGEMFESTREESTSDNIRLIAANFFFSQSSNSFAQFLLGNGHPRELRYWGEMFGVWPTDVGFIGELFIYGICWVLLYFYQVWLVLIKYKNKTPMYLKLFVLATFLDSFMIFVYAYEFGMLVWTTVLYLLSININRDGCKYNHS